MKLSGENCKWLVELYFEYLRYLVFSRQSPGQMHHGQECWDRFLGEAAAEISRASLTNTHNYITFMGKVVQVHSRWL